MQKLAGYADVLIVAKQHKCVTSFQAKLSGGAVDNSFMADDPHNCSAGRCPES